MREAKLQRRESTAKQFLDRVSVELKRAERYRIFVSLIVLDFGSVPSVKSENGSVIMEKLSESVEGNIRAIDNVSAIDSHRMALLFPETTRQGAEIASKRIGELIRDRISTMTEQTFSQLIPLEMASYPDAAGAKSISDLLKEMSDRRVN